MSIDIATLRPKLEAALGAQLQLGALLGQGGFAAVFRAHDPFLERDVAIKVLDPSLAVDAAREEQFLHEARTIAAAEHPHIVPLYSAESTGGLLYLVMRLLPASRSRIGSPRESSRRRKRRGSGSSARARWQRRMPLASCIVTSSPGTSCSTRTAMRPSPTSGSRA